MLLRDYEEVHMPGVEKKKEEKKKASFHQKTHMGRGRRKKKRVPAFERGWFGVDWTTRTVAWPIFRRHFEFPAILDHRVEWVRMLVRKMPPKKMSTKSAH